MNIPFVDLRRNTDRLEDSIFKNIRRIVASNSYILGDDVHTFEKAFASFLDAKYCVGVSSGTDAILLGLIALGIGKDDEVIAPAMTFISTVTPVIQLSGKPVLVDIESHTPVIDPKEIEKKITKKTKAIIAVHMHGHPADMEQILAIAKRHGLAVIEDACQAHGSEVKIGTTWSKAGTVGDVGTFSFYPAKNLGGWGDGGAVVTNVHTLAQTARLLRSHGQQRKNYHVRIGYTGRLDTLQAVVLKEKLSYLSDWNASRRKSAKKYLSLLADTPLTLPKEAAYAKTNYHVFAVGTAKRDALYSFLESRGIHCNYHYPMPLHHQPAFKFLGYPKSAFPTATRFAHQTLSLPMFPGLTHKEIEFISEQIHRFFK